jgi:hypothetical protein
VEEKEEFFMTQVAQGEKLAGDGRFSFSLRVLAGGQGRCGVLFYSVSHLENA